MRSRDRGPEETGIWGTAYKSIYWLFKGPFFKGRVTEKESPLREPTGGGWKLGELEEGNTSPV
jgi:hypothetical protein